MKTKKYEAACLLLFVVFAAFTFGYCVGRNSVDGTIIIETEHNFAVEENLYVIPKEDREVLLPSESAGDTSSNSESTSEQSAESSSSSEALESVESEDTSSDAEENGGLININTASVTALKSLPGIGDVLAQRIVDYRQSHGNFASKEAIKNVSGIGQKTYEKVKELITLK